MAEDKTLLLSLLSRLPLFTGLTPEQSKVIAAGSSFTSLGRGEVLFHQGDPVRGFFFVLRGQVQLAVSTAEGTEKVVEIVAAGESFGEAVVFDGLRYPVTAAALVPSELLAVSSEAVLDLLDRDPAFARRMLANMAVRLRRLVRDVESYSLRSGVQRVVGLLLHEAASETAAVSAPGVPGRTAAREAARPHPQAGGAGATWSGPAARQPPAATGGQGRGAGGSWAAPSAERPGPCRRTVLLPASKHVLASRLSLAPETFSRVLRELSAEGLISVEGRRITLLDVPGLEAQLQWK